jgi:hypothetical protein
MALSYNELRGLARENKLYAQGSKYLLRNRLIGSGIINERDEVIGGKTFKKEPKKQKAKPGITTTFPTATAVSGSDSYTIAFDSLAEVSNTSPKPQPPSNGNVRVEKRVVIATKNYGYDLAFVTDRDQVTITTDDGGDDEYIIAIADLREVVRQLDS